MTLGMTVFCSTLAYAESEEKRELQLAFEILFESGNVIEGHASCAVENSCQLLANEHLQLSIDIGASETAESSLSIRCGTTPCSFGNGKDTTPINTERQFVFYEGVDTIETPLVLKPKVRIGRILLK